GGRLAFGDNRLYRSGIDELVARVWRVCTLRVPLGDVDAFDAGPLHQASPILPGRRFNEIELQILGDVDQPLLDHPRHHAGVCSAAAHRGNPTGPATTEVKYALAQGIIRPLRKRAGAVHIKPGPGLDDGIDVERIDVLAKFHQVDRRRIDREIDDHASARTDGEKRLEDLTIVVAGDRQM